MFADTRTEWRVNDIEVSLRNKVDSHQFYSISSDVDRLERALREVSSLAAGLRLELQTCEDRILMLEQSNATPD